MEEWRGVDNASRVWNSNTDDHIYIHIPSILVYDSTSKAKIIRMNFPLQIESQSDLSITTTPDIRENLFKIHHIEQ